jgi:hypothetical protein
VTGLRARPGGRRPADEHRCLIAAVALAGLVSAPSSSAAPAADLLIKLRVRVAHCPSAPGGPPRAVHTMDWVDAHVNAARALLAPHGIAVIAAGEPFTPSRCELLTRADRDALASEVSSADEVTVLVVPRVRDLDVPSYDLKGVHWKAGGRRWIYLTAAARPPVLAHELCHYFGLPHDPAGGNLMTPGPSSPAWRSKHPPAAWAPVLTPAQVGRLRANVGAATRR